MSSINNVYIGYTTDYCNDLFVENTKAKSFNISPPTLEKYFM